MWKLDALFWLMDIPLCWAPRWVIFGWLCSGSGGCSAGFTDAPIGFGHSRVTGLLYVYNLSDAPAWVTNDPIGTRCSRVLCLWVFIIQQILRSTIGHSVVHSRNGLGASAGRFTKLGRFIIQSAASADASLTRRHNLCSMFWGGLVATLEWWTSLHVHYTSAMISGIY